MMRLILRNTQNTLLLSSALLVVLAFQRLQSYDIHPVIRDDGTTATTAAPPNDPFESPQITIGLFRFVFPHHWQSTTTAAAAATRIGDNAPRLNDKQEKDEGKDNERTGDNEEDSSAQPASATQENPTATIVYLTSCDAFALKALTALHATRLEESNTVVMSQEANQECASQLTKKKRMILAKTKTTGSLNDTARLNATTMMKPDGDQALCHLLQSLKQLPEQVLFVPLRHKIMKQAEDGEKTQALRWMVPEHRSALCGGNATSTRLVSCGNGHSYAECQLNKQDLRRLSTFPEWNCPMPWECLSQGQEGNDTCQMLTEHWLRFRGARNVSWADYCGFKNSI